MIAILAGSVIIALVLIGIVCLVASDTGWRFALATMAFSIAVTTVVAIGALLIGYGVEGHL